jgi:hypothetical protein
VRNGAHREAVVVTTVEGVDVSSLRQDMIEAMAVRVFSLVA